MSSTATVGAGQPAPVAVPLSVVGTLAGMELGYVSQLTSDQMIIHRAEIVGHAPEWPAFRPGAAYPLADTLCTVMVGGAPAAVADVSRSPEYGGQSIAGELGITSYVGVPVLRDGQVVGSLCGVDRGVVSVGDRAVDALRALAPLFAAELGAAAVWITRVGALWRVHGPGLEVDADDLTSAMVLADLICDELEIPGGRPARPSVDADEVARLRVSVSQLEHALAARVVVEQAIGVLAERRRISPRAAFETLRGASRGAGRKVHAVAGEVVSSAHLSGVSLTAALARVAPVPSPAAVAATRPVPRPPVHKPADRPADQTAAAGS